MREMPTLGPPPKSSPLIPLLITAAVVGGLAGVIFWIKGQPAPEEVAAVEAVTTPTPTEQTPVAAAPLTPTGEIEPPSRAPAAAEKAGLKSFHVSINGPLESAIVASEGKEIGTALTQVVNRSLVWWMKVPNDLVKGDSLAVVYETRPNQEPLVHAVRYESRKFGRAFETVRFKASGDDFARFYQSDATELEERLAESPIESYEQITSLLRDGRKHKGVDFKAPVGTPVKTTFSGVVVRKNWNFRGNGNSIELQETGGQGRTAMFLHLSELPKSLKVGQQLKKGEVFAKSGNTGHSFAPHLHYQLMRGEKVIDPFDSHPTRRAALPASERAAFEKRLAELKALMPAATVAGG